MPKPKRKISEPHSADADAGTARDHALRVLYGVWCATCLVALVLLIGVRWLRYTSWSADPIVNDFLREAMIVDAQTFLWTWVYSTVKLPVVLLALAIVVVSLHRRLPARLVTRSGGVWHLRRLPVALLLASMVWLHYGFDINPTIAVVCATSLILVWIAERMALPARVFLPLAGLSFAACLLAAGDVVDRLTIAVWALFLLATHQYLSARVASAHLALIRTAFVIPMNVLSAGAPLFAPLHGGEHLGDGLAYCFCEVPGRGTAYATVPVCDSVQTSYEDCRDSRIVEYDMRTMERVASHDFLSPDFYGRLELMVCLRDEVQVSVQGSTYKGERLVQNAMSFPVASPNEFTPVVAGAGVGNSIAYDEAHDAIFYTGEFNNLVVRYDRRTKQFDDSLSPYFLKRWFHPLALEEYTGSLTLYTDSIHPGRNRIYMAEWLHGRFAYAIDLTTLRPVYRYDVAGGGAMGITVDVERDRLLVSSLWGLEVFDLKTDRLILRKRTGLGNRPVIVDAARNQLYLSSMVEGKIRVLDRDTFEVIGQIPIGIGSRYAYLSRDGNRFLASSTAAHYHWDADTLARPRSAMSEASLSQ